MRQNILLLLLITGLCGVKAGDRPNILLIMCDQMTPFLTGAYGHEVVRTPNIDRLAAEGILFRNAYSPNPICAPARASMLTGKYSSRIGVQDNAAPLGSDQPTMAHYLSAAGYETVLSGKMHFVGPDQMHGFDKRFLPNIYPTDFQWTKKRFDKDPRSHGRSYQGEAIRIVPEGVDLEKDKKGVLRIRPASVEDLAGKGEVQAGFNESSPNAQFDRVAHAMALEYLKSAGKGQKKDDADPFFLCVSYNYPHEPFHPPKELWDLYEGMEIDMPEWPLDLETTLSAMDRWLNRHHGLETYEIKNEESIQKVRRAYYALVTYVDIMVGELLKELEKAGLADKTLVIFTSDHGEMLGEKGMVQKRTFYEWSSRVPLIFRMPDRSNAGRTAEEPVSLIDLLPTFLELAGIKQEAAKYLDGESLAGMIDGSRKRVSPVFSEMPSEGVFAPCFMVRMRNLKYNYFHGYGAQLFDLAADPREWNNLSGKFGYYAAENEMQQLIFENFDPAQIDREVTEGLTNRILIHGVMKKQGVNWNFQPGAEQNK